MYENRISSGLWYTVHRSVSGVQSVLGMWRHTNPSHKIPVSVSCVLHCPYSAFQQAVAPFSENIFFTVFSLPPLTWYFLRSSLCFHTGCLFRLKLSSILYRIVWEQGRQIILSFLAMFKYMTKMTRSCNCVFRLCCLSILYFLQDWSLSTF